jgi:hypothetical protein
MPDIVWVSTTLSIILGKPNIRDYDRPNGKISQCIPSTLRGPRLDTALSKLKGQAKGTQIRNLGRQTRVSTRGDSFTL